jgi:hypothetical protein
MRLMLVLILFTSQVFALDFIQEDMSTHFSGRVSRLNPLAKLMRVRIDFKNAKFLNHGDRVEFWSTTYPSRRCMSYVEAKTNEYLLLKVPNYKKCIANVSFAVSTYLRFYSPDFQRHMNMAQELLEVILKKRMALEARRGRLEKGVRSYIEKVDTLNQRYEVLRQKLELEWKDELAALEEDRIEAAEELQQTRLRLNELDYKLQQYRIEDSNLKIDRWSLDPKLYIKK